jgi:hypothetical protein
MQVLAPKKIVEDDDDYAGEKMQILRFLFLFALLFLT